MQIKFVAGFGPLVRDPAASPAFHRDILGLPPHGERLLIGITFTPSTHETSGPT